EVDQAMEVLFSQYKDRVPPAEMDEAKSVFRKRALENLINQSLLLHEADREGVQPDKEALDARLNQISGRFQDPEAFQKVLASMGVSEEGFRQEVLQNLKVESLLANKMGGLKKAEKEEIDAFYREHPESFRTEEQIRASHILVASGPDDSPDARAQKRLEMSRLQGEVKKGVEFAELARQHSDCPSKAKGGDLGYFERGKMVKAFEDAAFQMKTGEVSEIVETQFGYHLIKVTDHQQPGTLTIEQVRDDIAAFLEQQNREQAVGDYLAKLRGSAKIEYAEGVQP
ncbi:MAG: hypothetical protein FJY81_07565, partial [Candidatus Aminicenantes bacterium]|nr:hypothetical protein [Candidatus Aminicenantes bacterium]